MPFNRAEYPANWDEISLSIRRDRAQWHCERCGIAQGTIREWGSKVVLTVMHLNHDTTDNRPENLQAACQKCHLAYDVSLHVQHAHETRRKKQERAGQQPLDWEED